MEGSFRVSVLIEPDALREMMDALDGVMTPLDPRYRRVFTYHPATVTWTAAENSHPAAGEKGVPQTFEGLVLEFLVGADDLDRVLETIDRIHPYEEPVVDVIPEMFWRDRMSAGRGRSLRFSLRFLLRP